MRFLVFPHRLRCPPVLLFSARRPPECSLSAVQFQLRLPPAGLLSQLFASSSRLNSKSESTFMDDVFSTAAKQTCAVCSNVGLSDGGDGFFYCLVCGNRADDIIDAGIADEDFVADANAIYSVRHTRPCAPIKAEPLCQCPESLSLFQTLSRAMDTPVELKDHIGPTEPSDFGSGLGNIHSSEVYYNDVRMSYVYGLQLMINFQCEVLVEKFNVNPSICGISGLIWFRYLRSTRAFDDGWANEVQVQSQLESQGCNKMFTTKTGGEHEPRNSCNQRMVLLWYRSLRKLIPLSCSLAITYLSCHIAREPVLPTDIQRWTLEGKLPYLTAFVEIEKKIRRTRECPLSASAMFRPSHVLPPQKLESLAANIAQSVGLALPPVNFNAIASRYLKHLSLPVEKILPYACCIYDWSMPPGLWLSTCELRLPTRVCVMTVLIIAVRIMYNLNGFGKWEASLSVPIGSTCIKKSSGGLDSTLESKTEAPQNADKGKNCPSEVHKLENEASSLLCKLQKRFGDISEKLDYSKDFATYLRYCKDVVFGGLKPSYEDYAEEKMIKRFWDFYVEGEKDSEGEEEARPRKCSRRNVHSLDDIGAESSLRSKGRENSESSSFGQPLEAAEPLRSNCKLPSDDLTDISVRLMKLHMEENRFCYIPPRKHVKQLDYLHYVRKKDDGSLTYAVHADYYILLYACAREAKVDIRIMHQGVLSLERRLDWVEKHVDNCLKSST